jgi:hypothetical protein
MKMSEIYLKDVIESKWSLEKLNIYQTTNIEKHMIIGTLTSIYPVWDEYPNAISSLYQPNSWFLFILL